MVCMCKLSTLVNRCKSVVSLNFSCFCVYCLAPNLSRSRYLVMDEADRLLMPGFEAELKVILGCMTLPARQTLLFSATMTTSLEKLEDLAAMNNTLRFDLTTDQVIPTSLVQQYLFVPSQVKLSFLVGVIKRCIAQQQADEDSDEELSGHNNKKKRKTESSSKKKSDGDETSESFTLKSSMIIFVSTCNRCQLVHEVLLQFGIDCVTLHSLLSQNRRAAALGKFKSQISKVLVATDVASRGLDIPEVDLVINLDIPKSPTEYVHRVGRTARAGRRGRSLSIITPQEVDLVHAIEDFTKQEMTLSTEVQNKDIVPLLNPMAKAMKMAQLKMMEYGFDEKADQAVERKKQNRKKMDKKESKLKKENAKKERSVNSSSSSSSS
jgi:ATP-dependent RNA helicase DDX49/DBP8